SRASALSALAAALAQAGRFAEGLEVARGIESEGIRASALSDLATALASEGDEQAAGLFAEGLEVARGIQDARSRASALCTLAAALAQASRIAAAFTALGKRGPNEFIQIVAEWNESFDKLHPALSAQILREVLRIVGWVRPDWRPIHALLISKEGY
ncbi:MAG: hypothetical protein HY866_20060, partial [Chloroflexi bacterium]|nr:hypothetical protein [Chloroflexota bacterium]